MKFWPTDPDPGPPSNKEAWLIFGVLMLAGLVAAYFAWGR